MGNRIRELPADADGRARRSMRSAACQKEMALDELREALSLTQEHRDKTLNVKQSSISKMERRADMYVSTLDSMVRAMGGVLRIEAVFPERGSLRVRNFGR